MPLEEFVEVMTKDGKVLNLILKEVKDAEDLWKLVDVQVSAWGIGPDKLDVVPVHVLKAASDNSGMVIGVYEVETGKAVGFAWGFLAKDDEGLYFYSHQSGVVEDYKYSGIGFRIKQFQRKVALSRGLKRMRWTFDPLQALNTRFNLGKLGVVSNDYRVNFYGRMTDSLNRGLRSDRLKVWWYLDSRRVELKAEGRLKSPSFKQALEAGATLALEVEEGMHRRPVKLREVDGDLALIEIPYDINASKRDGTAPVWREFTGRAFLNLFSSGFYDFECVVDKENWRVFHILWRAPLEEILEGETPFS